MMRVLCVMERPETEQSALRELERRGHRVDVTADADAAIRLSRDREYDIVLVDQRLARKGRLDLLRSLSRGNPATCAAVLCCRRPTIDAIDAALGD